MNLDKLASLNEADLERFAPDDESETADLGEPRYVPPRTVVRALRERLGVSQAELCGATCYPCVRCSNGSKACESPPSRREYFSWRSRAIPMLWDAYCAHRWVAVELEYEIMKLIDDYGCGEFIEATGFACTVNIGVKSIRKLGSFVEFSVFRAEHDHDLSIHRPSHIS